jgi:hypothetical protein
VNDDDSPTPDDPSALRKRVPVLSILERYKAERGNAEPTLEERTIMALLEVSRATAYLEQRMVEHGTASRLGGLHAYAVFALETNTQEEWRCVHAWYADETERFMLAHTTFGSLMRILAVLRSGSTRIAVMWFDDGPSLLSLYP